MSDGSTVLNLPLPVVIFSIFIIFCIFRCFSQPNCIVIEHVPETPTLKYISIKQLGSEFKYPLVEAEHQTIGEHDQCSICLEKYQDNDNVVLIKCQHLFHTDCLEQWNKSNSETSTITCPLCNNVIYDKV